MTANPLDDWAKGRGSARGAVTVEQLHELAASLNRSQFVFDSGCPYFVGSRTNSKGVPEAYLDRKLSPGTPVSAR